MTPTSIHRSARRRRALVVLPAMLPPVLSGCAAGMATQVEESVTPERAIRIRTLAIMPITTETGSEGVRPGVTSDLHDALTRRFPELSIMGPAEARERLSGSPAATTYARLLDDYDRTGVVERDRVSEVARALEVDHFLQVRAAYLREDFLDTYLFDDEVVTEERQVLAVVARLWADRGSGPVWEAVVRTTSETDDFDTRNRRVEELIRELVDALAERMPVSGF